MNSYLKVEDERKIFFNIQIIECLLEDQQNIIVVMNDVSMIERNHKL